MNLILKSREQMTYGIRSDLDKGWDERTNSLE